MNPVIIPYLSCAAVIICFLIVTALAILGVIR